MDARPQRPAKSFRVQGDENVPNPQLHQRHKSTGQLNNMLGAGGLKAAAKRTVFGDVSNTAKTILSVRDDSAITAKSFNGDIVKLSMAQEKPAALSRPAQRPLNGVARIAANNNAIPPFESAVQAKAPLAESRQSQVPSQPSNKRTLSKQGTTIYKDQDSEQQIEELAPTAPVHQTLAPRHIKSQPQLKQDPPVLCQTQPNHIGTEQLENTIHTEPTHQDVAETHILASSIETYESYRRMAHNNHADVEQEGVKLVHGAVDRQNRQLPALPPVSEPEEYWEEEEEEVYDDQGYTTAHSYRSRGDNTTGGATTVLFPKVTNKAKTELAAAKELVESQRSAEDIEDELWDTSMVAEYGDDIFAYMRELEIKMLPNPHYMDNQAEIQWSMRSVLMDWLIQVHHRFSLLPETLFLCVNYIDRFLSCKIVSLGKLQLVGATAIFVAAKYEEINCPSVGEIVYMVDSGYTVDEILKAERFMLSMLQFELGWPGPMSFLRRISKADDYDLETRTLAKYFLEVTIMDERFVGSPPSYIAAGAHAFSRFMLKKGDWTPAHVYYSGYTWTQLRPLVSMIMECCRNPEKHHAAVFEKYSDRRYKRASAFVKLEMEKGFILPSLQFPNSRPSLPSPEDVEAYMPYETVDSYKRMVQVKIPSN